MFYIPNLFHLLFNVIKIIRINNPCITVDVGSLLKMISRV